MKQTSAFSLILSLVAILQSHKLDAQVVFARPKGQNIQVGTDTTVRDARLRVSHFDAVPVVKSSATVDGRRSSDAIDLLLSKAPDSLFNITAEEPFSGKMSIPLELIPAIPPVRFLTWQDYRVSSRFGWRQHPIGGDIRLHNGIDLPQPAGTPVFATADGVVKWISWQPNGLGLAVYLEHPTGYQSIYGHLSAYSVRKGDRVQQGTLIGKVGNTGRSTGPHLHYTILYLGKPVDPARYCFLWIKWDQTGWASIGRPLVLPAPNSVRNKSRLRNR